MRKVLNFIGTGTAFAKKSINNAAFYKMQNKLILFDCGETIFHEIINRNLIAEKITSIDIIITCFHSENVGSLGSLILYCHQQNIKEINVIYPDKDMPYSLLKLFGINENLFTIKIPNAIKDYYLKAYEQPNKYTDEHNHVMIPSYGYHFINDNDNLFYSGNTNTIDDNILKMFKSKKIYYLYQDISTDVNELKNLIEPIYRQRVMFMHLHDDCDINKVISLGFNVAR